MTCGPGRHAAFVTAFILVKIVYMLKIFINYYYCILTCFLSSVDLETENHRFKYCLILQYYNSLYILSVKVDGMNRYFMCILHRYALFLFFFLCS